MSPAAVALCATLLAFPAPPVAAETGGSKLRWIVEDLEGRTLDARKPDDPIHPASTVKLAASMWALESLGAEHRFSTRFGIRGTIAEGRLDGDLIVVGGADPDFHTENAYLVAMELNRAGIREIGGKLLVDERFWIGWEGGSEKRERDPAARAQLMARRLESALDPDRWSAGTRRAMAEFVERRGLSGPAPRVRIAGGVGLRGKTAPARLLLTHRSNPLAMILRRLNAFSNNDIERLETTLGPASELAGLLAARWEVSPRQVQFATLSGLGHNRLTPRLVVRLLKELRAVCARQGITLPQILPRSGCDPGTLSNYPRLAEGELAGNVVAKTGTLRKRDGGVAVLAGVVNTASGDRLFCTAAPRSGAFIERARQRQESWLLELVTREGAGEPGGCGEPLPYSDAEAVIVAEVDED